MEKEIKKEEEEEIEITVKFEDFCDMISQNLDMNKGDVKTILDSFIDIKIDDLGLY